MQCSCAGSCRRSARSSRSDRSEWIEACIDTAAKNRRAGEEWHFGYDLKNQLHTSCGVLQRGELRSARDELRRTNPPRDEAIHEESSPAVRKDVRVLHDAETWLGEDHDVVVLCAELSTDTSLCDLARLRHAADRYQCDLRRKAIAATAYLFTPSSPQYARRIERAWKRWRRHKKGGGNRNTRRRGA